jgi:hypothetical protein
MLTLGGAIWLQNWFKIMVQVTMHIAMGYKGEI